MRLFWKHTLQSAAFLCGLLVLLLGLSRLLEPKGNRKADGMHDSSAYGVTAEPENTLDVLILGDSESYSSLIPLYLWQDYGFTSYVCGTPNQRLFYSEEFLTRAFQKQSPKLVILETNALYRKFSRKETLSRYLNEWLPVFRYHDRWKTLTTRDFSFKKDYTHRVTNKGYWYNTTAKTAVLKDYMAPSDKAEAIIDKNEKSLARIEKLCRQNGATLMFLSTPSTKNWNSRRHNGVQALADRYGVAYLDMNAVWKDVGIDWKTDSRDAGDHLNYFGAKKATRYLGDYLKRQQDLPDHRKDPAYQSWWDALKTFQKQTEKPSGD